MNENLKNILSFIKEVLELKNKNIYSVDNYEIHIDFGQFYNQFKELVDTPNYLNLNINSDGVIFKIQYIKEENKKEIPKIPNDLKDYISIKNDNDIIPLEDDLENILEEKGLLNLYREYDKRIKEVNRYNNLIDSYNEKYMHFYNVYKRINDYEEKIEIIFGQKLLVWCNNHGNIIKRYILEANLEINVDSVNNIISFFIDKDNFRGFVVDFLNLEAYKLKDTNLLYAFVKEFNDDTVNNEVNWDSETKKYINYLSLENEIINRELYENEKIETFKTYLFNDCGIIVRNKNVKLWIEDLEKIINMCDTTKFQSPILNMFEVDFTNEEQVLELLNDSTYDKKKDEEILFPLPSNDEQYKIVGKVKGSNIVLVQGPPGTGKSHTIANLLSHYISEGKRVIVTSEKAKALEVLREKIPEQIRSLSLALLTSKGVDKDLEFSIENVLRHQEDSNELEESEKTITILNEKLKNNHIEKQEVLKKIINLMIKDTVSHKEELNTIMNFESSNNLTLMDIAIWLDKNRKYNLVPNVDNENYLYPNCQEFFDKLDGICDDIKNNCFVISTSIPVNDYLKNNEIELHIKEYIGCKNYQLHNNELISIIDQDNLNEDLINELGDKLTDLKKIYRFFEKTWVKSNVEYEVFIIKIKELINTINEKQSFFILTEEKMFDYNITYDDNDNRRQYSEVLGEILNLYDEKGNIHLLDRLKFSSYLKKLTGLFYNGKAITKNEITKENFIQIKNITDYSILVDSIRTRIKQILNEDLFDKYDIPKNQFGKYQGQILDILNIFINYKEYAKEIDTCFKKVIKPNLFDINYLDKSEEFIDNIYNDLKYYVTENLIARETSKCINDLRNYYKSYNLQNLDKVLFSIETHQLEEFKKNKNILLHEINVINQYHNLKNSHSNLVQDKQEFIKKYIYNLNVEERNFFKANIEKVFKYHYLEKFYLALEEKELELPNLFEERNKLINEEKNIISDLVSKKGWYYQNQHMNYNISRSLNNWVNLRKKLGKGTGKNRNHYLRQMREEMNTAKNAIPVWIMPVDKLIEQYPFADEPPFDVLIMDESSQSSIFSISALSRAKKVIIVGDDKQISPTNAFTSIDVINDLRVKYLKNNSWNLQISKDTSIYDIIQTICGNKKITLTEHFRCLPEIIKYSNKMFYNMQINPLKVRGKDNTIAKPIKTIYVPNAACKKNGSQVINQTEIDRIVMLIGEIANDVQYDNKTIGIITLQNNTAKYIQKLTEIIMQKFGEDFINERKIKIGITYDFQGDERDVIILAMVVSNVYENGDKYSFSPLTKQEFDRSFNVASSRAREQMILVHSVNLDDLSPNCNRYKLLNYCLTYDNEHEIEKEKLFESQFEKDIYEFLTSKGYNLIPQFKVGNYRIDFVLTNDNNQKIAIECDGDMYHGINELENDLKRQSILERCGWKFARIRASEFYYERYISTEKLIQTIEIYLKGNSSISFIPTRVD